MSVFGDFLVWMRENMDQKNSEYWHFFTQWNSFIMSHFSYCLIRWLFLSIKPECKNQGSFMSQMEWAPFQRLFWNTNDSVANLMISFTSGVSVRQTLLLKYVNLWQRQQMPKTYDNIKLDFFWWQRRYWLLLHTLT